MTPAIADTLALLRRTLTDHRFRVRSEADLQDQVFGVVCLLAGTKVDGKWALPGARVSREVMASRSRYDILVQTAQARIVLELKTRGAVAAVERQAQRYAMTHGVDAVVVVTTSAGLARRLADLRELGGKPFAVIALRSW